MHISRIRVPNFRALKNIDISFERDFDPRIFPLASVNGGGKSTLLQYLFILLEFSSHPESRSYIENLLSDFEFSDIQEVQEILSVEIDNRGTTEKISFWLEQEFVFEEKLETWVHNTNPSQQDILDEILGTDDLSLILNTHDYYSFFNDNRENEESLLKLLPLMDIFQSLDEKIDTHHCTISDSSISQTLKHSIIDHIRDIDFSFYKENQQKEGILSFSICQLQNRYKFLKDNLSQLRMIYSFSREKNRYNIATISFRETKYVLYCQSSPFFSRHPFEILQDISQCLFFLSSGSQVFLFLDKDERKTLFYREHLASRNYTSILASYRENISNLYIHDFVPIDVLLKSFEIARNEDFKQKNETGVYGDNYDRLVQEISSILPNKKGIPENDLSGVYFTFTDGTNRQIYPEDLSHGELKRLGIYLWLKNHKVKNSIVLIDELEIGLHPDWQYQIIEDLRTFFPDNQYIIATHSYDICEAVTPAHVKELSPEFKLKTAQ